MRYVVVKVKDSPVPLFQILDTVNGRVRGTRGDEDEAREAAERWNEEEG